MNQYDVHFEISGRKFRCKISAESREDAEDLIREAVVITEIQLLTGTEPKPEYRNAADDFSALEALKNIFKME